MDNDTIKIYEFLKDNGYIDKEIAFAQIEIKITTDDVPEIKATYPIIETNKLIMSKE